jgi:cytochrome c oxidase subunit IV
MKSISYLIVGLIAIFLIIIFMVTKAAVTVLVGIIMGGLTLALVPVIILAMKKAPRRDKKHQDSDKL